MEWWQGRLSLYKIFKTLNYLFQLLTIIDAFIFHCTINVNLNLVRFKVDTGKRDIQILLKFKPHRELSLRSRLFILGIMPRANKTKLSRLRELMLANPSDLYRPSASASRVPIKPTNLSQCFFSVNLFTKILTVSH